MGFFIRLAALAAVGLATLLLQGCTASSVTVAPPFQLTLNGGISSKNHSFFGLYPQGYDGNSNIGDTLDAELGARHISVVEYVKNPLPDVCTTLVVLAVNVRPESVYMQGTIGEDRAFILMPNTRDYENDGWWLFEDARQCAHFELGHTGSRSGGPGVIFSAEQEQDADLGACRALLNTYDNRARWMIEAWAATQTTERVRNLRRC